MGAAEDEAVRRLLDGKSAREVRVVGVEALRRCCSLKHSDTAPWLPPSAFTRWPLSVLTHSLTRLLYSQLWLGAGFAGDTPATTGSFRCLHLWLRAESHIRWRDRLTLREER